MDTIFNLDLMSTPETAQSHESARSKVMSSWQSSWKSIKKPPIIPMIDIHMSRTPKVNKTEAKVLPKSLENTMKKVRKENTLKLLTNSSNNKKIVNKSNDKNQSSPNILKTIDKELKPKLDLTQTRSKVKPIDDKINESLNEVSISERNDNSINGRNESKTNTSDKNSVYNKLRKRKNDSNDSSIKTGFNENDIKDVSETKTIDSMTTEDKNNKTKEIVTKENTKEKVIKTIEQKEKKKNEKGERVVVVNSSVEPLEVREGTDGICIRINCNKKINKFILFEDKYCSSDCAVKQWTEDFHKTWGAKNT